MSSMLRLLLIAIVSFTATAGLTACATVPTDPEEKAVYDENNDPLEPMNRGIFSFNQFVDKYAIRPAAKAYRYVTPEFLRNGIHNMLSNLGEPVNFANNVLQGRRDDAADSVARFVMNSTVGLAGFNDVATGMGTPERSADFGQTLYTWGVDDGIYLVLPLLGPSNPRDAVGLGVDMALIDPWRYVANNQLTNDESFAFNTTRTALTILDRRERALDVLDALERDSFDFYAQMRSLHRQHRAMQLRGFKSGGGDGWTATQAGN